MWLMPTILDSTRVVGHFHDCRKFCWTTLVKGQWFSNSVALWNHLGNLQKILKLNSTTRDSVLIGMKCGLAEEILQVPQVILTCSKVLEPLVKENMLSLSYDLWYIYPWGYKSPSLKETKENGYEISDSGVLIWNNQFIFKMNTKGNKTCFLVLQHRNSHGAVDRNVIFMGHICENSEELHKNYR